jgi:methylmalonyl-CoA mutase
VAAAYKAPDTIRIHACNSHINLSHIDAYTNMLRTTTEGMSALIGGCDSLTLEAYNKTFERTSDFSERIARNQQLILREESYLDKVADAAAGSYYVESLTDALAAQAWEAFREIEARGGFIACLQSDYIQSQVRAQAAQLIGQFRSGQLVLVGVNKFRNKTEDAKPRPNIRRISTGAKATPLSKICLSDYLVKENA